MPRAMTIHEIALPTPGGTHQSVAVPPTPTTKTDEVRLEPSDEWPPAVEKQAANQPEPLLPTETAPSNPEELHLQPEAYSDALAPSPSIVIGTSPPVSGLGFGRPALLRYPPGGGRGMFRTFQR
jgi:hypothetical protein